MGAHEDQKINMYESEEPLGSLDVYVHPNTWLCLNISVFSSNGIAGSLFQAHRSNPNRSFLKLRVTPSSHLF